MKQYTITWVAGYATADETGQDVGADFFTDGNGFTADDRAKIELLLPGQSVWLGGPADRVEIQRLQDRG